MNELALFAGAGGGILGGCLLGWRTVCAVEFDSYARRVLLARQADGCLPRFPIWDDVRTFDGRPWLGRVDVVSGGFPCQDISVAGKGAGITGERSGLWGHMRRIVGEVGPRYVVVENSPALTSRGLGCVLGDLASLGYDARWGVLGAHHAGAPHKRDRIWIYAYSLRNGNRGSAGQVVSADEKVRTRRNRGASEIINMGSDVGHANGLRQLQPQGSECDQRGWVGDDGQELANSDESRRGGWAGAVGAKNRGRQLANGGDNVANTNSQRQQERQPTVASIAQHAAAERRGTRWASDWWESEPDMGRVAHGVANRVDRLRCLGNGQVPSVAALAWRILTNTQNQ